MIWLDSLYLCIRKGFLSSFQRVLSVKYKLKAVLFSSFDLWGVARVGPITVSIIIIKKNQPVNVLVCVIRTRAHHLFLFFFLSQHVGDEKINQRIIK